ncbi:MAG: hypothetical protein AABW47_01495 [Nanoarchaeota archaeon]
MRKSEYGKEITFLWEGCLSHEQLTSTEVPSTLVLSPEEKIQIQEAFEKARIKNPAFFEGQLWKYEGNKIVMGGVQAMLSETTYSPHNILRKGQFSVNSLDALGSTRIVTHYPNPFSVNALQRTSDGYFLIGMKGNISDQTGELGVMGAGFIKREVEGGKNLPPKNIFIETRRECNEETAYANGTEPVEEDIESFSALGFIFGSNHDTTTCVYVPLRAKRSEISIGNQEHSDLFFLEDNPSKLESFLKEGGMNAVRSCDHAIGCIELYLKNKDALLTRAY